MSRLILSNLDSNLVLDVVVAVEVVVAVSLLLIGQRPASEKAIKTLLLPA